MSKSTSPTSIRKALISAVMLVTALCLSLSISISTYLDVKEQKQLIVNKLNILAEIIAFNAQVSVLFDDRKTEEQRLKSFEKIPLIKNIHIYAIDEISNKAVFFTSFNARKTPPVPLRVDSIEQLQEPRITEDYIELIKPITYEGDIKGYVYIRGGLERLNAYINQKILIDILLTLFVLILVYFVAKRIQKRIADPIDQLSTLLQDVSKNHNYSARAPKTNITEVNMLSNSLNIMLTRTQNQIERHKNDKQEIKQLNQSLEEKVNQRTIALREANQELLTTLERMHQYQNQIVESEKMASLGQMVAGVAHEVNTPIGLGITGSTLLRDKLAEISLGFEQKTLTSNQLKRFIDNGIENLDLIYRNLNRAAELVSSFKKVAVNQDGELNSLINMHDLITNVMLSMRTELEIKAPKIVIHCSEQLMIESKAGPLQQVLQQLLSNSIIHGFKDNKNNEIEVTVERNESSLIINYYDNGIGVDKSVKKRIFDPFVTTKRGEGGSGLGMHLVYNLVTQALGGSVYFDDQNIEGTRFIITLPLTEASKV
ncbi:MAG: signal transduction histidine kinase [Pseudoalteromonas rhizosphaerae]|jgi:signal transduction histidine kinase|uniref:histidine kinase n=1 Tax=Pseudoalteromonas neustonica TaxID=1840331 RepID=A0ABY3FDZ3_9GAMM|nr:MULTISPECIES: HAMP domain-containing sensor histidine kinase [Pseudoalteromonas]MBB1294312.1 HAMP domain-containing histidine kinase [Pseudoalteromonas sp. SR41-4]MBB1303421.1 HAMP domain-containing histidine kinase [Pseudoalteromonas sp. SR44-8]MBB1310037.1 HAMP domain-containing histidine kinase [Pseudoalteromonas sp. SR41-8]MBB1396883.1 HAMP domain-containing histidine kinase [Pseudoalteromonas sp. SG44-8]MBB1409659.1 HAMP domain-containing histidine kinase [Pseudoalteromonas sp. SG44-17|tara:strand:+ start:2740 stop:4365 length:1626 start_codon:yes stop_codon:yes gene_type:complete